MNRRKIRRRRRAAPKSDRDLHHPVTVRWRTIPGTATPDDFQHEPNTHTTLSQYLDRAGVTLNIYKDHETEEDEQFTVELLSAEHGQVGARRSATAIIKNGPPPERVCHGIPPPTKPQFMWTRYLNTYGGPNPQTAIVHFGRIIRFSASPCATKYQVQRKELWPTPGTWGKLANGSAGLQEYSANTICSEGTCTPQVDGSTVILNVQIPYNKRYAFRVRAGMEHQFDDRDGWSSWQENYETECPTPRPGAQDTCVDTSSGVPGSAHDWGLVLTEGDSTLTLGWIETEDADGYQVRWGEASTELASRTVETVEEPSFETPALSAGVDYAFQVRAAHADGWSEYSSPVEGSIRENIPAPNPDAGEWNLQVSESGSKLTVTWDAIDGATEYDVRWGEASLDPDARPEWSRVTTTEFTTPVLTPLVEQGFDVAACNTTGCSDWSPEVRGTVRTGSSQESHTWASPNFRVADGSPPLIRWDAYPDATGYTVEFTAPINWTGRKDNGYAEMSNEGPQYTMRARAHGDGWETEWTDRFNTCRPPYVHQGGPNDPPDCVEPDATGSGGDDETPPAADAGSDVEGKRGEKDVVLAGSGTAHADGSQELSYRWRIADASHSELAGLNGYLTDTDRSQALFTVPRRRDVSDRSALDDGNWIAFELTVTDGDGESASDTARLTIRGSTWTAVYISAADASADETAGEIRFNVALEQAARDRVTVDYQTMDGVAAAGTDFEAASGTLVFQPGETRKTVSVALLDDAIDEGAETFELVLSNPVPAATLQFRSDADRRATGTIRNTDPAQAAWLSRFGRAMATGVVDALGDRLDRRAQVRSGSGNTSDLSLLTSLVLSSAGGYGAGGYGAGPTSHANGVAGYGGGGYQNGLSGHANTMLGRQNGVGFDGHPMGGGTAGAGALFGGGMPMGPGGQGPDTALPTGSLLVPGGEGNRWTGWARTSMGHFSSFGGALPLHGQMRMGIFGADYEMGRVLAGVAISHGRGEGGMTPAGLDRAYSAHSSLTSVHPYVAFDLSEDLTVWGQAGYGRGEMALFESRGQGASLEEMGAYRTGSALSMTAAGVRGALPDAGGFQLAVKSDAFLVRTMSDAVTSAGAGNLAAGEAGVSRVRAALEGSRELRFAGGRTITPSVELGVRQDGGDAETGLGLETGFGVVYAEPRLGLMLDAMVNLLVAHQDSRYKEWGFSSSVRFDPGLAGRGLALTMMPSLGSASQGAGRLWAMQDMGGLTPYGTPFDMGGQFAADLGYGMAGPGGRGTGTPYAGVTQSGMGYRAMRYGWRWTVDQRFNVSVEGARQGGFSGLSGGGLLDGGLGLRRLGGGSTHSVQLRGSVTF